MQTYTSTKKLLVGNLPDTAVSNALEDLFKGMGRVLSVAVLAHGFAFVEMNSDDADRALSQLKGFRLNGKAVMIDEAHPRNRSRYE
jgi:RNA recognition motif-containing protein